MLANRINDGNKSSNSVNIFVIAGDSFNFNAQSGRGERIFVHGVPAAPELDKAKGGIVRHSSTERRRACPVKLPPA
jgi:hypothetical protein